MSEERIVSRPAKADYRDGWERIWGRQRYINPDLPALIERSQRMATRIDPNMPRNEVRLEQNGYTVGRIVNLGDTPPSRRLMPKYGDPGKLIVPFSAVPPPDLDAKLERILKDFYDETCYEQAYETGACWDLETYIQRIKELFGVSQ